MGIFDRFKTKKEKNHESAVTQENKVVETDNEVTQPEHGPYDIEQSYEKIKRLNMGALRIPAIPKMQLHLEPTDKEGYFSSVTLMFEESALNLMVLSDSKSGGTWEDLSNMLVADVTKKGGTVTKNKSRFGSELLIHTPVTVPDGRTGFEVTRFIGIEGPRWILRVIITGKALEDEQAKVELESALEKVVVDRGVNPLPPGEILLLDLPAEISQMLQEKEH